MDDLIGLNMDAPPAATASKPSDSLIDFDVDGMDDAPPPVLASNPTPIPAASPTTIVNAEEAARAWKDCLEASHNKVQYPLVPVIEGPFVNGPLDEFEEMWGAKTKGKHNFFNPFLRPTGPSKEHIMLLQSLHQQGHPIDHIAHYLVVAFPGLMQGWKTGTEYDRRIQIHGLVNIWVSMWAPQISQDGSVLGGEGDGGDGGEKEWGKEEEEDKEKKGEAKGNFKTKGQGQPYVKLNVPQWLKK